MKVFDVLSTMNPDALTSIQLETFSEPIAFGKVSDNDGSHQSVEQQSYNLRNIRR